MSWQSNPKVDPSIWLIGETGKPEWVVVRATTYPEANAAIPDNIYKVKQSCEPMSSVGHFASVAVANANQSNQKEVVPLWRGEAIKVRFNDIQRIE